MDAVHRRLARRIRAYARLRGLPLTHLADRAAVTRSHFWGVLGGQSSPTVQWLVQVAGALGIDAGDLIAREEPADLPPRSTRRR